MTQPHAMNPGGHHPHPPPSSGQAGKGGLIGAAIAALAAAVGGTALYLNSGSSTNAPAPDTSRNVPVSTQTEEAPPTGKSTQPGERPAPTGKTDKSTKPKPPPPDPG